MAPDYDILTGDVLMADGIKIEQISPVEHEHQQQMQNQFMFEAVQQKLQKPIVKHQQAIHKQVPRQAAKQQPQLTNIKSPEKFKQFDYIQTSNVTIAAAPPAAVQPITTMTATSANLVDAKPKIKILKKVAAGGISNGVATNGFAANLATTISHTATPTTTAPTVTTMKDASGTIVINKSNGNFTGNNSGRALLTDSVISMCTFYLRIWALVFCTRCDTISMAFAVAPYLPGWS